MYMEEGHKGVGKRGTKGGKEGHKGREGVYMEEGHRGSEGRRGTRRAHFAKSSIALVVCSLSMEVWFGREEFVFGMMFFVDK